MKPLAQAIGSWTPSAVAGDALVQVRARWPEIVGADVAGNSRPAEVARGALLVVTRSNAWSQQLAFLSERILAALREQLNVPVERLRFRVGRVMESADAPQRRAAAPRKRRGEHREPPPTLEAAVERFKRDVQAAQRAKSNAGWKECTQCGVRIVPSSGPRCVPCENRRQQEREAYIARLMFEVPWLGYAGIAPLVDGLTQHEYQLVRLQLLRRWKDALDRARRTGAKTPTKRIRDIASSYVLLKSELDPERIAPAVVRDLLGDELHEILYGN